MTWRSLPIVSFDTETTGTDPESARIVSACVGIASANRWTPRNWLLRQDQPIPAEATAVHGITTDYANEHGTDPAEALAQIRDDLYKGWSMRGPVVVYNAPYDLTLLDRELRRHSLGALEIRGPVLDPLIIDKALDRYRRGSRKLIDVAKNLGIVLPAGDAHGAEADALASARIAWKQAQFLDPTPKGVMSWQADNYREQRRSFAAYLAKQGKSLDDSSTDWPIRPYSQEVAA